MGYGTVNFDLEELVGDAETPADGHVRFEPGATYVPDVDGQATAVKPFIVDFDEDGKITQQLLAGIPWTVKFSVRPTYIAPVSFTLEEGDVLDLAGITETTAETVSVTVLYNAGHKADKSALDAESAARAEADEALDVALDDEATARTAGDAAIQSVLDGRLSEASLNGVYVTASINQHGDTTLYLDGEEL